MRSNQQRLANNMAGIEFVACMEVIKEFLQKNWKHSQIHRHLRQEGKITMSYGAFCYHMRRLSLDRHRPEEQSPAPKAKPTPPASKPLPPSGPRIVNSAKEPFPDPRKMSLEDGI